MTTTFYKYLKLTIVEDPDHKNSEVRTDFSTSKTMKLPKKEFSFHFIKKR